jgi:hypothetical protein
MYCSPVICPAANFLADAMLREAIFLECGQRRRRMFCQHWPRCVHAALGCANRILAQSALGQFASTAALLSAATVTSSARAGVRSIAPTSKISNSSLSWSPHRLEPF